MKNALFLGLSLLLLLSLIGGAGCSDGDGGNRIDIHPLVFSPQDAILMGSLSLDKDHRSYLWSYDISADRLDILGSSTESRKIRLLPGSSPMAFAYAYRRPAPSDAMSSFEDVMETESVIQFGGSMARESDLVLPYPYLEPQLFTENSVFVGKLSEVDPPQISLVALDINTKEMVGKISGAQFTSQYGLAPCEIDGQPFLFMHENRLSSESNTQEGLLHLCSIPDLTIHHTVPVEYGLMRGRKTPSSVLLYSGGQEGFSHVIASARATPESYRIKTVQEDVIELPAETPSEGGRDLLIAEEDRVVIVAYDPPGGYIISGENSGDLRESHVQEIPAMSRLTMDTAGEFLAWCDHRGSVFVMDLTGEVPTIIREIEVDQFLEAVESSL